MKKLLLTFLIITLCHFAFAEGEGVNVMEDS